MKHCSPWVDVGEAEEEEVELCDGEDFLEQYTPAPESARPSAPAAPTPSLFSVRKSSTAKFKRRVKKVTTNIVSAQLGSLAEDVELATGDLVSCKKCNAAFSSYSMLVNKYALDGKRMTKPMDADHHDDDDVGSIEGDEDNIWICEFCGYENVVELDREEMPTTESVDYIVEPAPVRSSADEENESILLFCIDVSGSMCVTKEVAGVHNLKGGIDSSRDRLSARRRAPAAPSRRKTTYVSRLQSVQAAVAAQIERMAKEYPQRRVGMVTFSNEVTILGDGSQEPRTITGDKLHDYDELLAEGGKFELNTAVKDAKDALCSKLFALEEGGPTALGPALVASVALAAKRPGSELVLCTDGLSNIGLGSLDGCLGDEARTAEAEAFYERVANYAQTQGLTINVISIEGDDCSVENLGSLTEITNGEVTIVDPLKIATEFGAILSQPVVATNVSVRLQLHSGLFFHETEKELIELETTTEAIAKDGGEDAEDGGGKDSSVAHVDVGNCTAESAVTFQYDVRSSSEMKRLGIDVSSLDALPFQLQIRYKKLDGMKCIRVITNMQKITRDRDQAVKDADVDVIGLHNMAVCADMAQRGGYRAARMKNRGYAELMERCTTASPAKISSRAAWTSKASEAEGRIRMAQLEEQDAGLFLDDDAFEDDEEVRRAASATAKSKAIFKKRAAARKAARKDATSKMLYNMKSKKTGGRR